MTQLKIIFRKLWRDRFFTFLKTLGLAIGIATCLVVFKIVNYEFSFDKKHPDKESIYQLVAWFIRKGEESGFGGVQSVIADYLEENFSEIEQIIPVNDKYSEYISIEKPNGEIFRKEDPRQIINTVPDYFKMVPYHWLAGDKSSAFQNPNQVVLTKSRAEEYFGKIAVDEILERVIHYENDSFIVSGIVADLDFPSSFDAKEFMAIQKTEEEPNWFSLFNS